MHLLKKLALCLALVSTQLWANDFSVYMERTEGTWKVSSSELPELVNKELTVIDISPVRLHIHPLLDRWLTWSYVLLWNGGDYKVEHASATGGILDRIDASSLLGLPWDTLRLSISYWGIPSADGGTQIYGRVYDDRVHQSYRFILEKTSPLGERFSTKILNLTLTNLTNGHVDDSGKGVLIVDQKLQTVVAGVKLMHMYCGIDGFATMGAASGIPERYNYRPTGIGCGSPTWYESDASAQITSLNPFVSVESFTYTTHEGDTVKTQIDAKE